MNFSVVQAQANVDQASFKLELLKISLERRLQELFPDDVNSNSYKMEILRGELGGSSPSTVPANHQHSTLTKAHQYSALAKAASLSGKLHCRSVGLLPLSSFVLFEGQDW